jgi:hypothetical protein
MPITIARMGMSTAGIAMMPTIIAARPAPELPVAVVRSCVVPAPCAAMLSLPWVVVSLGRVIPRKGVEHAPLR